MTFLSACMFCLVGFFLQTVRSVHLEQKYNKDPCGPFGFRCLNDRRFEICAEFQKSDESSYEGDERLYPPLGSQALCPEGRECDKDNPMYCTTDSEIRYRRFHGDKDMKVGHHATLDRDEMFDKETQYHVHRSATGRKRNSKHNKMVHHHTKEVLRSTAIKSRSPDAYTMDASKERTKGKTSDISNKKREKGNETGDTDKEKEKGTNDKVKEKGNETSEKENMKVNENGDTKNEKGEEKENETSDKEKGDESKDSEKQQCKESSDKENGHKKGDTVIDKGKGKENETYSCNSENDDEEDFCSDSETGTNESTESVEAAIKQGKSPPVIFEESEPHRSGKAMGNGRGGTYEIHPQGKSSTKDETKPSYNKTCQVEKPGKGAPSCADRAQNPTPSNDGQPEPLQDFKEFSNFPESSQTSACPNAPPVQTPCDSNDSNFKPLIFDDRSPLRVESPVNNNYNAYEVDMPSIKSQSSPETEPQASSKCNGFHSRMDINFKGSGNQLVTAGLEKRSVHTAENIVSKRDTRLTKNVDNKRCGSPSKCVVVMPPSYGSGNVDQARPPAQVSCGYSAPAPCGSDEPPPKSYGCEEQTSESFGCNEPSTESSGCEEPSTESCGCDEPSTESSGCNEPSTESCGCDEPSTESSGCNEPSTESSGCNEPSTESCGCNEPSTESSGCEEPSTESCGCEEPNTESSECKTTTASSACETCGSHGACGHAGRRSVSQKESVGLEESDTRSLESNANKRDSRSTRRVDKKRSGCPSKCVVIMPQPCDSGSDDNQPNAPAEVSCGYPVKTNSSCECQQATTDPCACEEPDEISTESCGCDESTPKSCGGEEPSTESPRGSCGHASKRSGRQNKLAGLEKNAALSSESIVNKRDTTKRSKCHNKPAKVPTAESCGCEEEGPPPMPCAAVKANPKPSCNKPCDSSSSEESDYGEELESELDCDSKKPEPPPASCPPKNQHHFNCNSEGKFADKYNCTTFFVCHPKREQEGFHSLKMSCPVGEVFDPTRQRCVPESPLDDAYGDDLYVESQY